MADDENDPPENFWGNFITKSSYQPLRQFFKFSYKLLWRCLERSADEVAYFTYSSRRLGKVGSVIKNDVYRVSCVIFKKSEFYYGQAFSHN